MRPASRAIRRTGTTQSGPRTERVPDPLKPRVEGLVRLARKAGRIVVGIALTRDSVRAGRARAVWIADDLVDRRAQALLERWRSAGIAIYRGWTKEELGDLAGKAAVAVLSVTDSNIAAGISQILAAAESNEKERQRGES